MALKLVTPPVGEPVSLDEAKQHLRVSITDDDSLVSLMIQAAREDCESVMRRQILKATWLFTLDNFPISGMLRSDPMTVPARKRMIEIPMPTLQSVTQIQYVALNGTLTTLDPSTYIVDAISEPGRIMPLPYGFWPLTQPIVNAVQITFDAGWTDATVVPQAIKAWIKLRISALYEQREAFALAPRVALAELPRQFVDSLLDRYIVPQV